MAGKSWTSEHNLIQQLASEPHKFSFVQATRLIELFAREQGFENVGTSAPYASEGIRFKGYAARSFSPNEIISVHADKDSVCAITVAFIGLFGPNGVLPQHDTQKVIDEKPTQQIATSVPDDEENDQQASHFSQPPRHAYALKDFLDLFNHRTVSLFYRAVTKYRLPFGFEDKYRFEGDDSGDDLIRRVLGSLAGLGTEGLEQKQTFPDEFLIEFSGLFRSHSKNAVSLSQILTHRLGIATSIQQFSGQWLHLSRSNLSYMPTRSKPDGQNCELGSCFIVGDRIWDVNGKFRIQIGPAALEEFNAMLPGSKKLIEIAQIARSYVGPQFDFDIQIELLATEVPQIQLDGTQQLGFNTWLLSEDCKTNRTDAVFMHSGLPIGV